MNPFDAIGNFFGGLFGKKKKEEKQRPQVTVKQPTRPTPRTQPFPGTQIQTGATVKMPGALVVEEKPKDPRDPFNGINIGGVKMKAPTPPANGNPNPPTPTPLVKDKPKLTPANSTAGQRLEAALVAPKTVVTKKPAPISSQLEHGAASVLRGSVKGLVDLPKGLVDVAGIAAAPFTGWGNNAASRAIDKSFLGKGSRFLAEEQRKDDASIQRQGGTSITPTFTTSRDPNEQKKSLLYEAGQFIDPVGEIVAGVRLAKGSGKLIERGRDLVEGAKHAASDPAEYIAEKLQNLSPNRAEKGVPEVKPTVVEVNEAPRGVTVETPRTAENPIATPTVTTKTPAITSANRPATTVKPPSVITVPEQGGVRPPAIETPTIPDPAVKPPATPQEIIADATKAIDEAAVQAPNPAPAIDVPVVESRKAAQTREIAENSAPVAPVDPALLARQAANKAPTEAIAQELGTISRRSVADGSINTPEGRDSMLASIESAATKAAADLGTDISSIIRKGQKAWRQSKSAGKDLTPAEAEQLVKGFTPEEQAVYKAYAQEIGTLRDRSGLSLDGGYQGEWYGPRQSLNEVGESAEFDPRMVNEIKRNRNQDTGGVADEELDVSTVPYQQAIQRYADSPSAAARTVIETAETNLDTGATRLLIPDRAKEKLETSLKSVVEKRDQAMKLADEGDVAGAKKLRSEVNDDINDAFNDFIDAIPGSGADRRQAVKDVKALRGAYKQTSTQTLALSNVVNRVADQGAKVVLGAQQPVVRALNKAFGEFMARRAARKGAEAFKLNTDKNARRAAKEMAQGTLWHELRDNFTTNVSFAGAGRNPVAKAIAKIDAFINASGTAATQAGDISTHIMRRTFEVGLSRPGAKGLKTVDEYKEYLSKYVTSNEFKRDLDDVSSDLLPRIGLAGFKNETVGGGKISNALSKVDNGARLALERVGIKDNRLVEEINGYVKSNITGYAGVGSRVFGTVANAAAGGIPKVVRAAKLAESGDPAAVARATQMAAQSVADGIALYGAAAIAAAVAASDGDVIGFTGPQAEMGSSEAAYNQSNGIPANQWYVNIGGNRIYFDPARPLGAAGVGADIAGGLATAKKTGGNALKTAQNALTQTLDQVGGTSIIKTANDVMTVGNTANQSDAEYAARQIQKTLAPGTGIFNNIANFTDDVVRDPQNFIEDIKSNLPVLRKEVGTKKDAQGNDIKNIRQVSGGSWIFGAGKNTDSPEVKAADPTRAEIDRLQKEFGDVFPTKAADNATMKNTTKLASLLMKSSLYGESDDETKAKMMADTLKGTDGKEIHDSLPDDKKTSLLLAKLMGEDKRKVWLENNDNAASYYAAIYDNKKANKTLTSDDDNLENKSGARYKMIRAQVDKDLGVDATLKQLYDDISSAEWRAMTDPESEDYDPDTAGRLLAYDDARTKAGVSGKDGTSKKNKYVLKTGKGGSGRGGSGSDSANNGKFVFASLPDSLVAGVGGSSKDYADAAPTFQPIADLKAPTVADIPKGRSISIKRGIQI